MNDYLVSFVFFISLGESSEEYKDSIENKDNLLDYLDTLSEITDYDVENDGDDWCIECYANVEANSIEFDEINGVMNELLKGTDVVWDYHYVKGIDNDEYWQP